MLFFTVFLSQKKKYFCTITALKTATLTGHAGSGTQNSNKVSGGQKRAIRKKPDMEFFTLNNGQRGLHLLFRPQNCLGNKNVYPILEMVCTHQIII